MKIQITSRKGIEKTLVPFGAETALISICDSDSEFAKPNYTPGHLLQLKFDDVGWDIFLSADIEEYDEATDEWGILCCLEEGQHDLTEAEMHTQIERYHAFTDAQAQQIADFYFAVCDAGATTLICQCEHGESRSAAVGAAIAEFQDHSGIWIFANEEYCPNKYVFHKVYEALKTHK